LNYPEPQRPATVGSPGRSAQEIRSDIEIQREQLGQSVDRLRAKVGELTDWRGQIREHRRELIAGAAIAGFVIGGIVALRRRR
jgi:orotate phosphoribosyltransferase-like protein